MSAVAMQTVVRPRLVATVAGAPTAVFGFDAQHDVNQPIGTASVTLPLPLPSHLTTADGSVLNQKLEIQSGFDNDAIRTVFSGRIDADSMVISERERTATFRARGWATLLDWEEEDDLVFRGPIALNEIIRSLCQWRGVPAYRIDPILTLSGATVMFGGNGYVDDGHVRIPRRTSPLTWIDRKCRLYGYRIFDTPSGEVRVQRVSGAPTGTPVATYGEGVNAYQIERTRDLKPMATYWLVEGATYTDRDGVQVPIRSFAASVPSDPLLVPPGYRAGRLSDNDIVTIARANDIRQVQEVDNALPYREVRWDARGDAWRQPGEVVTVQMLTFGATGRHWLMGIRQRQDASSGYTATWSAWSGGASPLTSGDDLVEVNLGSGPWHVGDEYLSHYAKPSPQGTTVTVPFTVPDEYTSIAIRGRGHGVNSYLIDGGNTDSSVSTIEVWQGGDKAVGSAEMPVMPENLEQRLPYASDAHWTSFRMPVPGRLNPGPAEIRIVAGEDTRASGGPVDDFEVKNLVLELRGFGRPALPRKGVA